MSGLEIAGIVLGAFPLIIHLADGYMNGVHTIQGWARHQRQLMHLKQLLETEQTRFLNTCDSLFRACTNASTSEIETLLAGVDPAGAEWAKYQESLRGMLGRSYDPYIATIVDMNNALEEMKEILNRYKKSPGSKCRRPRRLAFTLSKHKREELLDRISKNNNMLAALFEQRQRLEVHKRRTTSSGYGRIRQHCINLYDVLSQAWGCCCKDGHIANLHLPTLMANHMALQSDIKLQMIFQAMEDQNNVTTKWQWQQAYIQQLVVQEPKLPKRPVSTSCMSSTKPSKKFHVPSPDPQLKPWTRKERFKLAVAVSTSVLQFDDTPWLKQSWGTDDIHFLVNPSSSMPEHAYLSTVFSQSSKAPMKQQNRTKFPPLIRNKALFALGIVLIELAFGRPLSRLRTDKDVEDSGGMQDLVDTFTIKRLLEGVEDEAGYDYSEAVRRCIECPFDGKEARFSNDAFQEAVHDWIIEPLKVSLKNFCGPTNAASY
ncbi:hypothetical protein I7I51_05855 [Histoplasma capsulatum]|uniref:DUF7580 domain-containing protein n=1 Tax=Ajellomyces capsulatus TaxID=5037 RepID=A0A8A1MA38_AJECA|nr:hypothetical protein I7I51_05855 [Histoplasma capsulatum]